MKKNPSGREDIRSEETVSIRKRQYPSGIDRIRCLKRYLRQLTFVIEVIDVDDGDERLDLKRSSEIGLARADNNCSKSESDKQGQETNFSSNAQSDGLPEIDYRLQFLQLSSPLHIRLCFKVCIFKSTITKSYERL